MRRAVAVLFAILLCGTAMAGAKKAEHYDFFVPVTAGVFDHKPWMGAGVGYKFSDGLSLAGQFMVGRTDQINASVPFKFAPNCYRNVPVVIPSEQKVGFGITLTIPIK